MRGWILTMGCAALLLQAGGLEAQRAVWFSVGGGLSEPQGALRDGASTGWHALGSVALTSEMHPIGLRLDAAHNRFEFGDELRTALGGDGEQSTTSGTLNLTYRLPMTNAPLSPYLITGLGAYYTECSLGPGCDGTTRYGWNAGLGTKLFLLGVRSFIEARYHRTERGESDVGFFPITFGVTM